MEIRNPGGIYGRLRIDQWEKCSRIQEILYLPPHWRYWELRKIVIRIPTIRREMEKYHLREPVFLDERGNFAVIFYKKQKETIDEPSDAAQGLELFCRDAENTKRNM